MSNSIDFDRAADYYDETRGMTPEVIEQAIGLIVEVGQFDATKRILEIGIGTGRIALPLAPHVHSVTGVDLSRKMLQRLVDKRENESVHISEGDVTRLPFADDTFDGAVSVHVLHLIPNWQDAVSELARVLKTDAPLVHAGTVLMMKDIWEDVHQKLGEEDDKWRVGLSHKQHDNFLDEQRWRPLVAEQQREVALPFVPQRLIIGHEQRQYSSTWLMDDEALERRTTALREVLQERFGDLSQTVEINGRISARAYLPPT